MVFQSGKYGEAEPTSRHKDFKSSSTDSTQNVYQSGKYGNAKPTIRHKNYNPDTEDKPTESIIIQARKEADSQKKLYEKGLRKQKPQSEGDIILYGAMQSSQAREVERLLSQEKEVIISKPIVSQTESKLVQKQVPQVKSSISTHQSNLVTPSVNQAKGTSYIAPDVYYNINKSSFPMENRIDAKDISFINGYYINKEGDIYNKELNPNINQYKYYENKFNFVSKYPVIAGASQGAVNIIESLPIIAGVGLLSVVQPELGFIAGAGLTSSYVYTRGQQLLRGEFQNNPYKVAELVSEVAILSPMSKIAKIKQNVKNELFDYKVKGSTIKDTDFSWNFDGTTSKVYTPIKMQEGYIDTVPVMNRPSGFEVWVQDSRGLAIRSEIQTQLTSGKQGLISKNKPLDYPINQNDPFLLRARINYNPYVPELMIKQGKALKPSSIQTVLTEKTSLPKGNVRFAKIETDIQSPLNYYILEGEYQTARNSLLPVVQEVISDTSSKNSIFGGAMLRSKKASMQYVFETDLKSNSKVYIEPKLELKKNTFKDVIEKVKRSNLKNDPISMIPLVTGSQILSQDLKLQQQNSLLYNNITLNKTKQIIESIKTSQSVKLNPSQLITPSLKIESSSSLLQAQNLSLLDVTQKVKSINSINLDLVKNSSSLSKTKSTNIIVQNPYSKNKQNKSDDSHSYTFEVRKSNRWEKISSGSNLKNISKQAQDYTDQTSVASFRIKKGNEVYSKPLKVSNKFYRLGNSYIEKKRYRIDSIGELSQITKKGLLSLNKKGFF